MVFLYAGWRIGELLTLKTADADLKEMIFKWVSRLRTARVGLFPFIQKFKALLNVV